MKHLDDVNETYFQHLYVVIKLIGLLIAMILVLVVHGLMPFCFQRTASQILTRVNRVTERTNENSQ